MKAKLALIGGFLGSGKTTLLVAVAKALIERGHTVAIITNDQGETLVDTGFARSLGITSAEVGNGCFCCNFSDFVSNIRSVLTEQQPEYVLAEPVGSCTDLASTVLAPLALYHHDLVELIYYGVLVDGPRLLGDYTGHRLDAPVAPREVLLVHQIAEAPIVLVSKSDLLTEDEQHAARERVEALNPRATIVTTSAYQAESVEQLVSSIITANKLELPDPVPIDYKTYGQAEAEMGWLNGRLELVSEDGFFPDEVATEIALRLKDEPELEVLHAKVLCVGAEASTKVSLVGGRIQADEAVSSQEPLLQAAVIVNVRAATTADALASLMDSIVAGLPGVLPVRIVSYERRALTPAPPVPEHRLTRDGRSFGQA